MGKSSQYNHYMRAVNPDGTPIDVSWTNIEEEFAGLRYLKAEGLLDKGKAKNIYTESYAESDRLRVYLPTHLSNNVRVHSLTDIANEPTTITMTFVVIGDKDTRQAAIDAFEDYVRKGVHSYYDDARNKEFDFIVTGEIKVSDEKWHGSQPYVEVQIPMQNLNGKTRIHQTS